MTVEPPSETAHGPCSHGILNCHFCRPRAEPPSDCPLMTGMLVHRACPTCGHRADAHALHGDGAVTCDVCAIIRHRAT